MSVKHIFCLFPFLALVFASSAWGAADLSRSEAAPMEKYLEHFTAQSKENLRFGSPEKPAEARKILDYALRFAQMDDPAKFSRCPRPDCPYGGLRVEKKYVDEAIKRYFGHDPQNYPLLNGKESPNFERGFYHTGDLENSGLRPRLKEAKLQPVGLMLMRGDVLDHMGETIDKFTALAWPSTFGTQNTWALVSLIYDNAKKKK